MFMTSKEKRHCQPCNQETSHVVVLVRKESAFAGDEKQSTKEFIAGLIKGWAVGPFLAEMDDFERHLICECCGQKTVED
ncbi:hypothetical protein GCM10011369_10930 [Neiella marina]|uniref:Uncharacterized protein n=1 Tax=Neiella marina TaxID=508461 RepID=A0A8J2U3G5_9GAMM|nr:hypothetical protein [Neiella marina]GGA71021.1 hypothetical protein GCM10011369_10930 [Neiella marina]